MTIIKVYKVSYAMGIINPIECNYRNRIYK